MLIIGLLLVAGHAVEAFWRLPCKGRTAVARIDPLAQFGRASNHAHAIHGGNAFNFESTSKDVMSSECTSCAVKEDKSVYWTPALYFEGDDGKTELVEQVGGLLVYYQLFGKDVQTFQPGFQMIAGDTKRTNFTLPVPDPPTSSWSPEDKTQDALAQKALGFNCMNYHKKPEPTLFRHFMPDKAYLDANCPHGVRLELVFPSCWNGELDSPDHKSHMAYPDLGLDGDCPEGFKTRLVTLLFETIWDTHAFAEREGHFVIANGDTTGYGYHGDFITGWDPDFLSQAIQICQNESGKVEDCPLFKDQLQTEAEQRACNMTLPEVIEHEDCQGPRDGLPGKIKTSDPAIKPLDQHSGEDDRDQEESPEDDPLTTSSSVPTLSYTAASTGVSNAPLGIDIISGESSQASAADEDSTTATPSIVSTMYRTEGNQVFEIHIVQETVSVGFEDSATATTTETTTELPSSTADAETPETPTGETKKTNYLHRRAHLDHAHRHHHLHRRGA